MQGNERFKQLLNEWLVSIGAPANAEPMEFTIARAKNQILRDVRMGIVPQEVKSFSELHDYVDANGYGDAFEWPDLPSESEDDLYNETFCNFWNKVQNELHNWIATGKMQQASRGQDRRHQGEQPSPEKIV